MNVRVRERRSAVFPVNGGAVRGIGRRAGSGRRKKQTRGSWRAIALRRICPQRASLKLRKGNGDSLFPPRSVTLFLTLPIALNGRHLLVAQPHILLTLLLSPAYPRHGRVVKRLVFASTPLRIIGGVLTRPDQSSGVGSATQRIANGPVTQCRSQTNAVCIRILLAVQFLHPLSSIPLVLLPGARCIIPPPAP